MSKFEASQLLSDLQQSLEPDVDRFALVIAIDFGTAESGYAYAFPPKHNGGLDVKFNKNWAEGQGFQSYKTRTCVLVNKTNDGDFEFGYEAEDKYINLKKNEKDNYEFYDRFKMALHKERLWGEETKIKSRSGNEANALDIFTMSIEYLRKHIFRQLSRELLSINPNMVRWVITVPAIWSVNAKQFMRKAAYQAGLITRLDSKRLMIALEPEAASLTCRNLALHRFTVSTRGNNLPHGTDYLLLDCGGGTVDIIAHKVISDDTVKEIEQTTMSLSKTQYSLASQLLSDPDTSIAVVLAIDFGTAESGYAYAFTSKDDRIVPDKVEFNKNWKMGHFQSYKTRTCVLVDAQGDFVAFGYAAEDKYIKLKDTDLGKYELYDRFKMALHTGELWGEETIIKSRSGKKAKALDIFTMSLKFFKEHILKTFSEHLLSANEDMVRWVITVPAIWSVGAKQFMRKAANRAGLTTREDSKRLLIALEPEAASLACRKLPLHRFTEATRGNTLPHGTDYLLLDCGGGTVDIIAHKVISNDSVKEIAKGLVKEIYAASGGPWGGIAVNDNFEKLLKEICGSAFIEHYKATSPPNWLKCMRSFEMAKRSMDENNDDIDLDVPIPFRDGYCKFTKRDFMSTPMNGVRYSDGVLTIEYQKMKSLFKPVVDKIIEHVETLMKKPALKNVKFFFLVGGFSNSNILQDAIKKAFEKKVGIIIPAEASKAIMEGAVWFGYNPRVITHRISGKTYGFAISEYFDANKHPESRKYFSEGQTLCKGCFKVMVKKGQEIAIGEEYICSTVPETSYATGAVYRIFETDKEAEDVKYVDEDPARIKQIGELVVSSPVSSKGKNRPIEVNFCIGDTELYINITDKSVAGGAGDVKDKTLKLVFEDKSKGY